MSGLEPILIGAAVGAGTSAIMGGDPLKGAALGGATGGLFGGGGVGGLFGGGSGGGTAGGAAGGAAQGAAGGLVFNPATGSFLNPEYYALATSANPIYTGAGSLGSKFTTGFGSIFDTPTMQGLREYMPSGQALGKLGIDAASQSMMRQQQPAPAGGISQGKPLDISAVEDLVKKRRAQVAQAPQGLMGNYFG